MLLAGALLAGCRGARSFRFYGEGGCAGDVPNVCSWSHGGGWRGQVSGISCRAAGQFIFHHALHDFQPSSKLSSLTAIRHSAPGKYTSAGFECRYHPLPSGAGWQLSLLTVSVAGGDHRWPLARVRKSPLWRLVLEWSPLWLVAEEWATAHRTPLRTLERMIRGSLLLGRGSQSSELRRSGAALRMVRFVVALNQADRRALRPAWGAGFQWFSVTGPHRHSHRDDFVALSRRRAADRQPRGPVDAGPPRRYLHWDQRSRVRLKEVDVQRLQNRHAHHVG